MRPWLTSADGSEMSAAVDGRRRRRGREALEVGDRFPSLRSRVQEAPGPQPEGGLLVVAQIAGVEDVLDVAEPLPAPHPSLDVQSHRLDIAHQGHPRSPMPRRRSARTWSSWLTASAACTSATRSWARRAYSVVACSAAALAARDRSRASSTRVCAAAAASWRVSG